MNENKTLLLLSSSKKLAMACPNETFSYEDVLKNVTFFRGEFLNALGGDLPKASSAEDAKKIAIFAENSPRWAFTMYGAWSAGATVVPIDAKSNEDELEFILTDSDAEIVCADAGNLELTKRVCEKINRDIKIFELDKSPSEEDFAKLTLPQKIERDLQDLALVVYTSGTTGNPKGVMLSFANLAANMRSVAEAKYYQEGIRVLIMLPFHHILPVMGTLVMPLSVSGTLVFPKSISPADIAEILQKYPVDMVVSVPRFYELIHANVIAKIGASKLAKGLFNFARVANNMTLSQKIFAQVHKKFGGQVKYWICGGAALDKKVGADLSTLGFDIREGYGMTECAPIITFPRTGRVKLGSPGEALTGVEIRIVDGEIAVRGGNVTKGYYRRPEETAQAIRNGWLFTGDLGYLDDEGFLFITGRRKEIIVLPNGKNLNPADMEAQLKATSPEIIECGILMYENMLQAIVRVSEDFVQKMGDQAEEHIRNNAILPYNRNTAMYKRVIRFTLTTEELPRTRVGKLKRYHLAAYLENISSLKQKARPNPEPDSEIYRELKSALASQVSMPVTPDSHMEMDLGLDSLGKISIQCFVRENYGVEVVERDFEKFSSLRSFCEHIEKSRDLNFEPSGKNVTWEEIVNQTPYPELIKPNFFHFLTIDIFRLWCDLCYKLEIQGTENLPDGVPLIIAPNHQCYMDALYVTRAFTKTQIYKTRFFAKTRSIIKRGLLKSFARHSNVLIMDINDNVSKSIQELAQVLRSGERVVIFPEGTRTKDGKVSDFKQTFAILAKHLDVPVVPVAISGAYEALKAGATFPKIGSKIKIEYLPAMKIEGDESYEDFSARVRKAVEEKVEK